MLFKVRCIPSLTEFPWGLYRVVLQRLEVWAVNSPPLSTSITLGIPKSDVLSKSFTHRLSVLISKWIKFYETEIMVSNSKNTAVFLGCSNHIHRVQAHPLQGLYQRHFLPLLLQSSCTFKLFAHQKKFSHSYIHVN